MALTKVIGNGLGTLGDGTANDTKIVFDGNAQDYHIGLDDSADALVIGKGSALGTTTSMSFDENGIITKPLQPAFLVRGTQQNNIANGTTLQFGTEIFDQNSDFASNAFTAPVTGRYQLSFSIRFVELDSAATFYIFRLETSNTNYNPIFSGNIFSSDVTYYSYQFSLLVDMDANDTASVVFIQSGGTAQTDNDASNAFFSGHLVC